MKSIQYTIRNVPPDVDKVLRARARKSGKSFNSVVVDEISTVVAKKSDFSEFYKAASKLSDDDWKSFDRSMKWLDNLPNEIFDK